ncbi:MmgE/PrpD family protein [uncultured Roseobacter sp.]|uniref:MmgE/PrpD family protein n=1 Tax=uncultured Roseobacter sp. TaxID=114847 RepID=UPI002623EA92|nr:MmgE/PrpD family protein [uncultured Roseobacter sp.]
MSITDSLIDLAQGPCDADALRMMELSLFDWAVCGIAGARDPAFAGFREAARAASSLGRSTLFGGGTASAATAALINGTLSHALDYDDTHFAHIGHPSVAVVPAVLALAHERGAGFDDMVQAALTGVEASVLVGTWLGRGHYQTGFHQTATAGAFGATLGAARLCSASPEQTRMALGLCASMASGLKSQFGTMAKPLNAGLAARTGVEAVLWAQVGMTAAADGLAGPLGFGETHHGAAEDAVVPEPGQPSCAILDISHKFHACCHGLHAMLEAISQINCDLQGIESVDIFTHPRWMTVCNQTAPDTGLGVKFSYAHTAAMALSGISTAAVENFSDRVARSPELIALRRKVRVHADETLTEMQARVEIRCSGGSLQSAAHDLAAPMPLADRQARLQQKAGDLVGAPCASDLWQAVQTRDLELFTKSLCR